MDLKALRYFVAAVDLGSITAAAEACFIAQPSITAAIRKLELEFDAQLLARSRRGVVTTAQGETLYRMAQHLLHHAASVEARMTERESASVIQIGVIASISYNYLNQVLRLIREQQPGDSIFIRRGPFEEVSGRNTGHRTSTSLQPPDLLLTASTSVPAGYDFIPLWRDQYCVILPPTHHLAYQPQLAVSDFHGIDLIERAFCELRAEWDRMIGQFDQPPNIVATVDNEEWALQLVASGIGITFAPVSPQHQTGVPATIDAVRRTRVEPVSVPVGYCARPLSHIQGIPDRHRTAGIALRRGWQARSSFEALFFAAGLRFSE